MDRLFHLLGPQPFLLIPGQSTTANVMSVLLGMSFYCMSVEYLDWGTYSMIDPSPMFRLLTSNDLDGHPCCYKHPDAAESSVCSNALLFLVWYHFSGKGSYYIRG